MTPKEKADELFTRYYVILLETDSEISEEVTISILSQQLALIAVDEILKECADWCIDYYEQVKEEINKL